MHASRQYMNLLFTYILWTWTSLLNIFSLYCAVLIFSFISTLYLTKLSDCGNKSLCQLCALGYFKTLKSKRVESSVKLAESLSSFGDNDDFSISSLNDAKILYRNFCYKKNKIKWVGSLEDLKAVVLDEVDEEMHQNATWRSPSGGTWKFESDVLSVTWQMKSQNIYFEGEKSEEMSKRIISLINQYKNASMNTSFNQGKVCDAEPARSRVVEQTLDKHGLFYPQLHEAAECKKTSSENGDVMIDESADVISSNENNEKNAVPQVTFNKSYDVVRNEVSDIKYKLNQHVRETRAELQQLKHDFTYQLDQLRDSCNNPGNGKATGGGQKKSSPHQKWLTWFIMAINKGNINKSYLLVLVWLAACKCKR